MLPADPRSSAYLLVASFGDEAASVVEQLLLDADWEERSSYRDHWRHVLVCLDDLKHPDTPQAGADGMSLLPPETAWSH